MKQELLKYVYANFERLVEDYGFVKIAGGNKESYSVEYGTKNFTIRVDQYFREFYIVLYKTGNPDKGVNLYNLLDYLRPRPEGRTHSNYFANEKDLEESYRKQFEYFTRLIYDNINIIDDFFTRGNYEAKLAEIRKFVIDKNPGLF